MITVTNKHGLPDAIVRAVLNDPYDRGDADFTVTQLLQPPQLARLTQANPIPEDVSDRIWALLGHAVHVILELWPIDKTIAFLHERIRDHVAATPRPCSDEERWHQPDKWALMKKGRKTAIKLFEAPPDHITLDKEQFIEKRPGAFRRCESYCS